MFSELWKQKSELCFGLLSLIAGCIRGKEKWGGHSQNDTLSLCLDVPPPQGHQRSVGEEGLSVEGSS